MDSSTTNNLEHHRSLITKAIEVARAIEKLQQSMEALITLGEDPNNSSNTVWRLFNCVSNQVKKQSTVKISEWVTRLNQLIKKDLNKILAYSEPEPVNNSGYELNESDLLLITEFRRHSLTIVGLRVLLKKRGAKPIKILINRDKLQTQLVILKRQEELQRARVRLKLSTLIKELEDLLSHEESEEAKDIFKQIIKGLESDISAIDSGKKLDELPLSFEEIDTTNEYETTSNCFANEISDQESNDKEKIKLNLNFFQHLKIWFNTPWNVKWKNIKK